MAIYRKNKKWSAKKYTVCEFADFEGTTIAKQYLSDVKPIDFDRVKYKDFPFIILDLMEAFEAAKNIAEEQYQYDEMFETDNISHTMPQQKVIPIGTAMSQLETEQLEELRKATEDSGDYESAAKFRDEIKRRNDTK